MDSFVVMTGFTMNLMPRRNVMKTEKFLTFFQGQSEISCKRLKSLVGKNTFVFQGFVNGSSFDAGVSGNSGDGFLTLFDQSAEIITEF